MPMSILVLTDDPRALVSLSLRAPTMLATPFNSSTGSTGKAVCWKFEKIASPEAVVWDFPAVADMEV